jgi:uncharacterized membrane protein YeiH
MFDNLTLITILTILATTAMAVSAAIQAARNEFDLFGAAFLAVITAVGGGTMRDLLIGNQPVFWLKDQIYVFTAVPVGMVAFFLAEKLETGLGRRKLLLNLTDAVGLALFTIIGMRTALAADISPVMAVLLGCITGIGGGILRDIICGETPLVLKKDIYATLSLAGGGLYLLLRGTVEEQLSLLIAFLFILLVRVWLVFRPLNMG